MHFLLWTKGSHENTNFDTFKCSDENFPNHKSIFLQILHDSSLSWNITLLYFFRSNVLYFVGTNQSAKVLDFLVLGSKFTKLLSFLKLKISFFSSFAPPFGIMRYISSTRFLAETLYTFSKSSYQNSNLVKFHLGSQKSEILHCGGLLL